MDTKAMFNQFLEFSKQHSDSSGSGNIASAGDFEKFNMLMKWMNKEGTTKDDIPEGPISQAELGGSHSEHDLMHEEDPDPIQMDDSSERSTNDSNSEKDTEERAEKGNEIEDNGQREGTGDDEEGKDGGETNDVLEQYFSKKQNPLKRKIHVTTPSPYELKCFAKRQTSNRLKQALLKYQRDSGDTSSSGFKPGDSVVIIRRGKEIGSAIFIEKQDELFAELAFSSHASGHGTAPDDSISLYKPVAANDMIKRAEKVSFDQLEPKDLFSWKLENIKKKISRTLRKTEELKAVDRLYWH